MATAVTAAGIASGLVISSATNSGAAAPPPSTSGGFVAVSADGVELAAFNRCVGLGSSTEVVEYRSTGSDSQLIPGDTDADRIVCQRALSADLTLASYHDVVRSGNIVAARKELVFEQFNSAGSVVARWTATDAFPSAITYGLGTAASTETVTFVAETIQRSAP